MNTLTQTHQHAPTGASRLGVFMATLGARYAKWRMYRQTLAEMSQLSQRELADLGLHRSELKRVAMMAVYND